MDSQGTIKDIHTAVVENDYEKVKSLTEDPVPPVILSSKDINGMTALHKVNLLFKKKITRV